MLDLVGMILPMTAELFVLVNHCGDEKEWSVRGVSPWRVGSMQE